MELPTATATGLFKSTHPIGVGLYDLRGNMKLEKTSNGNIKVEVYLPVKRWLTNNTYVKEVCCICHKMFSADSVNLYEIEILGYLCYDCCDKLKIKENHLDKKRIEKIQNKFFNMNVNEV